MDVYVPSGPSDVDEKKERCRDPCIETAMRRKYVEITKALTRELKKRNEALVLSGGVLDTEGLDEEVCHGQPTFRHFCHLSCLLSCSDVSDCHSRILF